MSAEDLIGIEYDRKEGPDAETARANCQKIAKLWYERVHDILLPPEDALSAESFDDTRALIVRDLGRKIVVSDFVSYLKFGDLIHAERKKNPKKGEEWAFDRRKNLHLAVFAGSSSDPQLAMHFPTITSKFPLETPLFFHGTNGGSRFTPVDEFVQEYQLVQARRIPDLKEAYQTIYHS